MLKYALSGKTHRKLVTLVASGRKVGSQRHRKDIYRLFNFLYLKLVNSEAISYFFLINKV